MEEEKNSAKKDSPVPKINVWERLIKLDKRNNPLTIFNDINSQPLSEDQKAKALFWWPTNQTEQNIRSFWNHLNENYFVLINDDELKRIDYLSSELKVPTKDLTVKYADPTSYETFKSLVTNTYKHLYSDPTLSQLNLQNLQKYFYLTVKKKSTDPEQPDSTQLHPFTSSKGFKLENGSINEEKSKPLLKSYLEEEAKCFGDMIIETQNDSTAQADLITQELQRLMKEKEELNKENLQLLANLKEKPASKEDIELSPLQHGGVDLYSSLKSLDDSSDDQSLDNVQTQIKYLEKLIIKLDNQQAAESLKCVTDCKKLSEAKRGFQFCAVFDEAIASNKIWLDEATLQNLDKLREHTLFKVYDIPQKTRRSIYSPNLMGFQYCVKKVENTKDPGMRDKKWKDLMKYHLGDKITGYTKEELIEKYDQLGFCHHCRHLFPDEILVKCNYKTPLASLPFMNSTKNGKNSKTKISTDAQQVSLGHKRHAYLFYRKHNGDLVCSRRFCRLCLKQNYDINLAEGLDAANFICPFCKENCYCSRCVRSEHINKLRTIYVSLGGDLENISRESYFERFVLEHDPQIEEVIKKKQTALASGFALKPTRGRKPKKITSAVNIRHKVEKYRKNIKSLKFMKNLRIQMEKARMLCAQLTKRETLKMQTDLLKKDIFTMNVTQASEITGQKRRGRKPNQNTSIEPPVSKKVKGTEETNGKKEVITVEDNTPVKIEEEEEEKAEISPNPVVKKRGRPRKYPPVTIDNPIVIEDDTSSRKERPHSAKKKALKDIKLKIKEPEAKAYIKKTMRISEENEREQTPPKKPRGRPRKIKAEEEGQMEVEKPEKIEKKTGKGEKKKEKSEKKLEKDEKKPEKGEKKKGKSNSKKQKEEVNTSMVSQSPKSKSSKKNAQNASVEPKTKGRGKKQEKQETESPKHKRSKSEGDVSTKAKNGENKTPKRGPNKKLLKASLIKFATPKSSRKNSGENPNEPNDNYKQTEKTTGLKKELQKILKNQKQDQFEVFNNTKSMGRTTRNSYNKNKLRKNKKYHYNQGLQG